MSPDKPGSQAGWQALAKVYYASRKPACIRLSFCFFPHQRIPVLRTGLPFCREQGCECETDRTGAWMVKAQANR